MKPLKKKEIFNFSIGDFGINLNFQLLGFFLAYFYTDVFGISAWHASFIFLIAIFEISMCPLCAGSKLPPSSPIDLFESFTINYGLTIPFPDTKYLYDVNWLIPTGPLGGSLLVEIPISPPKPNSPPSANCVDTLCIAIELFTPFKNI